MSPSGLVYVCMCACASNFLRVLGEERKRGKFEIKSCKFRNFESTRERARKGVNFRGE